MISIVCCGGLFLITMYIFNESYIYREKPPLINKENSLDQSDFL